MRVETSSIFFLNSEQAKLSKIFVRRMMFYAKCSINCSAWGFPRAVPQSLVTDWFTIALRSVKCVEDDFPTATNLRSYRVLGRDAHNDARQRPIPCQIPRMASNFSADRRNILRKVRSQSLCFCC